MEKNNSKHKFCPESMEDSANFEKSLEDIVIFHRDQTQNVIAILNPGGKTFFLCHQAKRSKLSFF